MIEDTTNLQPATNIPFQMSPETVAVIRPKLLPVTLFTGAGASVPLGMPTMNDFRKELSNGLSGNLKLLWNNIIVLTGTYYEVEQDRVDIEQVLTYIEASLFSYSKLMMLWRSRFTLDTGDRVSIQELENFRQQFVEVKNMHPR